MKICMITNFYDPYVIGGAERYVEYISKKLKEMGHEIIIITTKPFSYFSPNITIENNNGIKIYRYYPFNVYWGYNYWKKNPIQKFFYHLIDFWNFHSFFEIRMILKKENPDIIHIHNLPGISNSALTSVNSLNLPLVYTLHDFNLLTPKTFLLSGSDRNLVSKFYSLLNKKISSNIDTVIGSSKFVLNTHKKLGFFSKTKTRRIAPVITKSNKSQKKRRVNNIIDFLFVGHISKYKGIITLVEAFKLIKNRNIRLHIVGSGPELKKVKKMTKGDKRIKFYGFMNWNKLQNVYNKCDFFITPTLLHETFSLVILESFKFGLPVIGSKVGAVPELIKDGFNGYLFEPNNIKQLKSIMEKVTKLNKNEIKKMRKNAKNFAKKYDSKMLINNLVNTYKNVIIKNKKAVKK